VAHDDLAAQFSLSARSTRSFVGRRFATAPPRWRKRYSNHRSRGRRPASTFTRDGYREDRFAADHLKKIKEVENNGAVVGQSAMWRYYLTNRTSGDMLAREYPFLKFGAAAE